MVEKFSVYLLNKHLGIFKKKFEKNFPIDFIIKNLSVFSKVPRKIFYQGGKKCQLMPLSRVWVGRISKTRGVLETSECPKSIQSFRFPKFIIHFVTIFDESSVVKFLNLEKK